MRAQSDDNGGEGFMMMPAVMVTMVSPHGVRASMAAHVARVVSRQDSMCHGMLFPSTEHVPQYLKTGLVTISG